MRANRDIELLPSELSLHFPIEGHLHHRVQWCKRELGFAEEWKKIYSFLPDIIGRTPTKSDYWTAASLFQWLGSNVGLNSVYRALQFSGNWIHSEPFGKPIPDQHEDPLLKSMAETMAEVEWEARRCKASHNAAQMLFDLSEPN